MITYEQALEAAQKLAGCDFDPARTVETEWCWAFEPKDALTRYGRERRQASPAVVMKADGRVKLYARYMRAAACVEFAEKERQARQDARDNRAYPTIC